MDRLLCLHGQFDQPAHTPVADPRVEQNVPAGLDGGQHPPVLIATPSVSSINRAQPPNGQRLDYTCLRVQSNPSGVAWTAPHLGLDHTVSRHVAEATWTHRRDDTRLTPEPAAGSSEHAATSSGPCQGNGHDHAGQPGRTLDHASSPARLGPVGVAVDSSHLYGPIRSAGTIMQSHLERPRRDRTLVTGQMGPFGWVYSSHSTGPTGPRHPIGQPVRPRRDDALVTGQNGRPVCLSRPYEGQQNRWCLVPVPSPGIIAATDCRPPPRQSPLSDGPAVPPCRRATVQPFHETGTP